MQSNVAPVTWDLASQYPDAASWSAAVSDAETRAVKFANLRGTAIKSAAQLANLLDEARYLRGRAGNLARFAFLNRTIDTTNDAAVARFSSATGLEARVEANVGWIDSAIVALGAQRIREWQQAEPRLEHHGWHLARALNSVGHQLPVGSEPAYAELQRMSLAASDIHDALMAANTGWPIIKNSKGETITVSPDAFDDVACDPDTKIRRSAIEAYQSHLRDLEEPMGLLLTRKFEADDVLAHGRNYNNSFDAFFGVSDGTPPGAYHKLIETAQANIPVLAHFGRTLGRLHNVPDIRYSELNFAPPESDRSISLNEAKQIVIEAVAPLGADYQQSVRDTLSKPWYDVVPRPHKTGEVGVWWQVGGGHPMAIMTYKDTLRNSQTFAALAALVMFYNNMPEAKLPERREEDFPIYGNAVWWSGSLLEIDRLLAMNRSRAEKIALLAGDLRRLWSAFFIGAIDADFEDQVNTLVANNKPPTGAQLSRLYADTLRKYYQRAAEVTDPDGEGWITLGNEFSGHVLAEWSFAIAGAAVIAEGVEAKKTSVIKAIAAPMSQPGSYTSYDLMRDVGADPISSATYNAVLRRMNRDMDELDKLLDK